MIPDYILISFGVLVFVVFILLIIGYRAVLKRAGMEEEVRKKKVRSFSFILFFWLLFLGKISQMDFFHNWSAMPPRLALAVLPPLIFEIVLIKSKRFVGIIRAVPQHWLMLIQSFRIAMEIILLMLFLENIIPKQMTFEGRNFDIIVGFTALVIAHFAYRSGVSRKLIIGWNIFGLILLANIVVVAILSAPLPFRVFMNEPANTVVAYFPFVWLPGFLVPVAYTMHFISIKKCLAEK